MIIASILILLLFIFSVSATWRIGCIIILILIWKGYMGNLTPSFEWGFRILLIICSIGFIISLPRYLPLRKDRVRLYYINKDNQIRRPPFHHWIMNAILPEEELCHLGIKTSRIAAPLIGIGEGLKENLKFEKKNRTLSNMINPYRELSGTGENPMSAAYTQGFNQFLKENNRSFYLIRPKNFDKNKEYPLVVFCHGYMGNWKQYTGVMMGLENCIVVCMGTPDLIGHFFEDDIKNIHDLYIPLLHKWGYKIKLDHVSIMGLSNGGTAVSEVYKKCSYLYRNIVFISTWIKQTFPIRSKVIIVGGSKDPSAMSMKNGYEDIRRNNPHTSLLMLENATHFTIAINYNWIIPFLNKELGLI